MRRNSLSSCGLAGCAPGGATVGHHQARGQVDLGCAAGPQGFRQPHPARVLDDHRSTDMRSQFRVAGVRHSPVHRSAVQVGGRRRQPGRGVRKLHHRQAFGLQRLQCAGPAERVRDDLLASVGRRPGWSALPRRPAPYSCRHPVAAPTPSAHRNAVSARPSRPTTPWCHRRTNHPAPPLPRCHPGPAARSTAHPTHRQGGTCRRCRWRTDTTVPAGTSIPASSAATGRASLRTGFQALRLRCVTPPCALPRGRERASGGASPW
jgi:hypothetical protein